MSRRDPPCIWDSSRSARPLPRGFTDHVTDPFRSIHQPRARQASDELRRASNEGTLRAFRNADRFPTFKIFRRPGALRRRFAPGQSRRSDRTGWSPKDFAEVAILAIASVTMFVLVRAVTYAALFFGFG